MKGLYDKPKLIRRHRPKGLVFITGFADGADNIVEIFFDPAKPLDGLCIWRISNGSSSVWLDAKGWQEDMQERIDEVLDHHRRMALGKRVVAMVERRK